MRETDSDHVAAAEVYVDTRAGAPAEAGDRLIPLQGGRITQDHVRAELAELTLQQHPGRTSTSRVTLFKSVGAAQEDLAAEITCYEQCLRK